MPAPRNVQFPLPEIQAVVEEAHREVIPAAVTRLVRKNFRAIKSALIEAAEVERAEFEEAEARRKEEQGENYRPTSPTYPTDASLIDVDLVVAIVLAELDRGYLKDVEARYFAARSVLRDARKSGRAAPSEKIRWVATGLRTTRQTADRHLYLRPNSIPELSGLTRAELEQQVERDLDAEESPSGSRSA